MKVSICLFICLLFVSVGVNMAHEEMLEENGFMHELVKRSVCSGKPCHTNRHCCKGWMCYGRKCKRYGG
ncbi:uncharacterized protein LOC143081833 [Mytilus galloprovincialis]|uniref:CRP-I 4 n=1 Tax=Mytilus galloprovincialis TaxID=29158 RepID=A0A0A7ACZ9_MYTGA|nr:CRP-I 4 [Mytilus galloprovincialis]